MKGIFPWPALLSACITITLATGASRAVITIPGADGSDGALNVTTNTTIDLSQAPSAVWTTPGTGNGVYDASKWAVVFKYSSVNIASGATLKFTNHPSGAPVVWLVQGNVTVSGKIDISAGGPTATSAPTVPGPGGFRGGAGGGSAVAPSAGFGPGGAPVGDYGRGNFGDPTGGPPTYGVAYSNVQILPLVGGSGGSGYSVAGYDGGAGGGAILIAAGDTITVTDTNSAILAYGGAANIPDGGSGGAIRLIADKLIGTGQLRADGQSAGLQGRIRLEANTLTFGGTGTPTPSISLPNTPSPDIWPTTTSPTLRIVSVGGVSAPADPHSAFTVGSQDVTLPGTAPAVVRIQATNMPTTWTVYVRAVPVSGKDVKVNATLISGDATSSIWEATINPTQLFSALQARAKKP